MPRGKINLNNDIVFEKIMFTDFTKIPMLQNLPDTTPDWVVALGFQLKDFREKGQMKKMYFDEDGKINIILSTGVDN